VGSKGGTVPLGADNILFGSPVVDYREKGVQEFTLVVTQDCNLRCRYCYLVHKHNQGRMSFETARKAVEFCLNYGSPFGYVIWEFMGGECLLEIDLIDAVTDYIKVQTYRRKHKWWHHYTVQIGTNGVLYDHPKVQAFLQKNVGHVDAHISIDGTPRKHDMHRIFADGRGSYEQVARNVKLWHQQFPGANTKVTFASTDLPLLAESIIHLWDMGLRVIPANVVYEDVWKPGDDLVLEEQLRILADFVINNRLWKDVNCSFFDRFIGYPLTSEESIGNGCGAGLSFAVASDGLIYPCVRFMPYSLQDGKPGYVLGDIEHGIDPDRLRPFRALTLRSLSRPQCVDCEVATGCTWCAGFNYDSTPSLYDRATFICKMHKARVRANEYFYARLKHQAGVERSYHTIGRRSRYLYFITSSDSVTHCGYLSSGLGSEMMADDVLLRGLRFSRDHFYRPVVLHSVTGPRTAVPEDYDPIHIARAGAPNLREGDMIVYENEVGEPLAADTAVLVLDREQVSRCAALVMKLWEKTRRVNLIWREVGRFSEMDLAEYEKQLQVLTSALLASEDGYTRRELNVLTDRLYLDRPRDCRAGNSLALAPNGRLYLCPAFYFRDPELSIGTLEEGADPGRLEASDRRKCSMCQDCGAFQCRRCLYDNLMHTGQVNVPSESQCVASHLELRTAAALRRELDARGKLPPGCPPFDEPSVLDPLRLLPQSRILAEGGDAADVTGSAVRNCD